MKYVEIEPTDNDAIDCFVEDCNLFAVFDVPTNVLFAQNFKNNIENYKDIFVDFNMDRNIFFSCKSNKSYHFLKTAAEQGCGIEVSSYYELKDALKYTKKIIASGIKEKEYLNLAIKNNIIISVDDIFELKNIIEKNVNTNVLLRINNINEKIISRFGICLNQLDECIKLIENSKVNLLGFSFHINNYNLDDRISGIKKLIKISKEKNISIKYIDIGGGFPSNYCSKENYLEFLKENNSDMYFKNKKFDDFYTYYSDIANEKCLRYILENTIDDLKDIQIIIEPGRSILNNCGISIYKVEYLKQISDKSNLIITNGNINCLSEQWFNTDYLIRPKLIKKDKNSPRLKTSMYASIAGNLCLEQDMITWRKIKFNYLPEHGDYLIYYNTAGYQMDSNESEFHKLPLVPKYVVDKEHGEYVIRKDVEYDCK